MESLKKEVQELLTLCEQEIRPVQLDIPSIKYGLYKEMMNYLCFLAASDTYVHDKEKKFMNVLFDTDYTLQDMATYISKNKIYTKEFEQKVPPIFSHLKEVQSAKVYIDVFSKIGKEFIVIDQKADEKETENYGIYINMLTNSFHKRFPDYQEKKKESSLQELLEELDSLIGLQSVKNNVHSLVHLQDIQVEREKRGLPKVPISNHLVFTGNPGTGKTTVARLVAKIYKQLGVLSTGVFVEADRSSLVAGYVGQTAIKTNEVIDQAIGGVLFIDEAYSLSNHDSQNDFGHEAIETLLKRMEDDRDNLIVIVAGYSNLMEDFIHSNPGLESRFRKKIHFEDYSPKELNQILLYTAKHHKFEIQADALAYMEVRFEEQYSGRTKDFANAREVRNCFETAVIKQADRLFGKESLSDLDLTTLTIEDFK